MDWINRLRYPPPVKVPRPHVVTPRAEARKVAAEFRAVVQRSPIRAAPESEEEEEEDKKRGEEKRSENGEGGSMGTSRGRAEQKEEEGKGSSILPLTFPYVRHHNMICREGSIFLRGSF